MFPPRREECVENVSSKLRGGAEDLCSRCRLRGGFHRTEEGFRDLLLFHLLPLPRYIVLFMYITARFCVAVDAMLLFDICCRSQEF